jgi:hypothetical protein
MSDRGRERQLDLLAIRFADALEVGDFDTVDRLWAMAATDTEREAVIVDTATELADMIDCDARSTAADVVTEAVRRHMPSAEILRPATGPLTVSEVAEHLHRHPSAGLTADDLLANERLRQSTEVVPTELGLSQVLTWGKRFGPVPESYWRAFRKAALELWMRRTAAESHRMAARPQRPKPPGGQA